MSIAEVRIADEVKLICRPFRPTVIESTLPLGPLLNEQWLMSEATWPERNVHTMMWMANPLAWAALSTPTPDERDER